MTPSVFLANLCPTSQFCSTFTKVQKEVIELWLFVEMGVLEIINYLVTKLETITIQLSCYLSAENPRYSESRAWSLNNDPPLWLRSSTRSPSAFPPNSIENLNLLLFWGRWSLCFPTCTTLYQPFSSPKGGWGRSILILPCIITNSTSKKGFSWTRRPGPFFSFLKWWAGEWADSSRREFKSMERTHGKNPLRIRRTNWKNLKELYSNYVSSYNDI